MKFWKYEAAGNDFVLLNKKPLKAKIAVEVVRLCHRHLGVGADGLIYCWQEKRRWNWRFFNADGSETLLCGNATRAVAAWLKAFKKPKKMEWLGGLGIFSAKRNSEKNWAVQWPLAEVSSRPILESLMDSLLNLNERGLAGAYLFEVGVPHLVLIAFDEWNMEDRQVFGPEFRSHPALGKAGANVTWLSLRGYSAVTFERGVEAETLACGSGAVAAFLALNQYRKDKLESLLREKTFAFPGGKLKVTVEREKFWLAGPTRLVFEGNLK